MAEAVGFEAPTSIMYAAHGFYLQVDLVAWTKLAAMHVLHSCPENGLLLLTTMVSSAVRVHLLQAQSRTSDLVLIKMNPVLHAQKPSCQPIWCTESDDS